MRVDPRCGARFVGGQRTAGALLLALLAACAHTESQPPAREPPSEFLATSPEPAPREEVWVGYATWYGARLAGRTTASGERFDPGKLTAAHRTLPFGTWLEVRRADTGESVRVRVTDRGPFGHEERIIDLSAAAARKIGMLKAGVAKVQLRIVAGP
ncbi:MAG TPA: septal ring lytic transglycosylase RlpA family protein [Polyangiaceae bacterium]|nr:septal ring lytic transglycosylase RlpA family protein [Polyangiaceae bacterium]